jgi:hypothetical protein
MLPYARMFARGARVAGLLLLAIGLAVTVTWPVAFRLDRVGRLNTRDGYFDANIFVLAFLSAYACLLSLGRSGDVWLLRSSAGPEARARRA